MFVKPSEGMKIWDPELRGYLPPEGRNVAEAYLLHWTRTVNDGDAKFLTDEEGAASVKAAEDAAAKIAADAAAAQKKAEEDAAKKAKAETPAPAPAGGKLQGDK